MKKILLIHNIPNPYRIPLFNELNSLLIKHGMKFKVIFGALSYSRRKWNVDLKECQFDYEILSSLKLSFKDNEKTLFSYSGVVRGIRKYKPDVIIATGFSIATLKIWALSFFSKFRYIIWSGSIIHKGRNYSLSRTFQRRILIKRASGYIAYGSKAKEYFISLGAPENKITIGINTVDSSFFRKETEKIRNRNLLKDERFHLTYIGYMSPRKNVQQLLKAIKELSKIRSDFILDLIGEGDEREKLEQYVLNNGLSNFVIFQGYKQKEELPKYLAKSSCLLFQTDFDIWGLVLIEGMSAGIPCIASIHAGATYDLIENGVTGFAVDFSDTENVVKKISWLLDNPEKARTMGENARHFIDKYVTIEKSAMGFAKAISNLLV